MWSGNSTPLYRTAIPSFPLESSKSSAAVNAQSADASWKDANPALTALPAAVVGARIARVATGKNMKCFKISLVLLATAALCLGCIEEDTKHRGSGGSDVDGGTAGSGGAGGVSGGASGSKADGGRAGLAGAGGVSGGASGSKANGGTGQTAATGPVIQSHPQSLTVVAGQAATFRVQASGASLTYQWLRSGAVLVGATGDSYSLASTALTDTEATFACAVSATEGRVVSHSAILTVLPVTSQPVILTQPHSLAVTVGEKATFQVEAVGTGTLQYQWSRNGSALSGAVGSAYTTEALVSGDDYSTYSVTVSDGTNIVTSATAILRVVATSAKPMIGLFSAFPVVITPGGSSTLTWSAAAATSLSLDNDIGAVTGTSLVVKPTTTTAYRLTAGNAIGSQTAQVTVVVDDELLPKPTIQTFKASPAVALPGDTVHLAWSVAGAKVLSIDKGVGFVSGASVTAPFTGETTYTLSASNEAGSVTAQVTVPAATLLTRSTVASTGGSIVSGTFSLDLPSGCLSASSDLELLTFPAPADHQATAISAAYVVRGLTDPLLGNTFKVTLPVTGNANGNVYLVVRDDASWTSSTATPTANDRLVPATISNGMVSADVPVSNGSQPFLPPSAGGTSYATVAAGERASVSFWAITGNYAMTSSQGNFRITYPITVMNLPQTQVEISDGLEKAYTTITTMGFTKGSTRDWPLEVSIEKISNEAETGYTFPGYYLQMTFGIDGFSGTADNLAATAGHELFHVFQSYYDPRTRWSKGRGASDQLWFDEAVSTWFQEKMVSKPTTYMPEDFAASPHESLIGLRQGMQDGTHGYGSASLPKWLLTLKSTALLDIYTDLQKGTHPIRAIDYVASNANYSWWYDTYVTALMGGQIYSAFDPRLLYTGGSPVLVDRANLSVKIDHDYNGAWYDRSITMPPFSARFFIFYPGGQMEDQLWDNLYLNAEATSGGTAYSHVWIYDRATKKLLDSSTWIDGSVYNELVSKRNWIVFLAVNPDDASRNVRVTARTASGCMMAGTPVHMADGPSRSIESLKAGDRILAWDEATNQLAPGMVKQLLKHEDKAYETLALSLRGRDLHLTGNHPVRTAEGAWVQAESLNPGDRVLVVDPVSGALVSERIAGIIRDTSTQGVVYNLKTTHGNYLAADVLVHNKCLSTGTLVDTPNGPRAVESLRVGDEVIGSRDGQRVSTRVTHVYLKRTALPALPGRKLAQGLQVTDNHPVWTVQGYVPAGHLDRQPISVTGPVYDLRTNTGNVFSGQYLLGAKD